MRLSRFDSLFFSQPTLVFSFLFLRNLILCNSSRFDLQNDFLCFKLNLLSFYFCSVSSSGKANTIILTFTDFIPKKF